MYFFLRIGRQMHWLPHPYHHEERQGNRGHTLGLRRFREHDAGKRDRIREYTGGASHHQIGSDFAEWQQYHDAGAGRGAAMSDATTPTATVQNSIPFNGFCRTMLILKLCECLNKNKT